MTIAGKMLFIDLTNQKIEIEPTSSYVKDYIGGNGIGTKLIYDHVPPESSGLDEESMLTFNCGVLTGTLLGNKCSVVVKSPQYTNKSLAIAGLGGQFPSEMKFAGYDSIAVNGKAESPVYIHIENDAIKIKDAKHLWGLDVHKTQERILAEIGDPDAHIVCIGPAGENLIAYSMIVHEIQNTAAKGGMGAVMGSKNLKAIVVRGTKGLKVANVDKFMALFDELYQHLTQGPKSWMTKELQKWGQSRHIGQFYPARNIQTWGYFDSYVVPPMKKEELAGEFLRKHIKGNLGSAFCPIQCQHNLEVPGVGAGGIACQCYSGYRYFVKSHDLKLWWKSMMLCNAYGIDAMTLSGITGWLMKLYEDGTITAADTDGVPMEWASEKAVLTVIEKVAKNEGFGKMLTGGIIPAAQAIGRGSDRIAVQSRNMSVYPGMVPPMCSAAVYLIPASQEAWIHPPVDKDAIFQLIADHNNMTYDEAEKEMERWVSELAKKVTGDPNAWREDSYETFPGYAIHQENVISACDISGHCDYQSDRLVHGGAWWDTDRIAQAISAGTGMDCSEDHLLEVVQRRRMLELAYHELCKRVIIEEDVLPFRLLKARPDGYYKGQEVDIEKLYQVVERYCQIRGMDPETMIPLRKELVRLGLEEVADRLGLEPDDAQEEVAVVNQFPGKTDKSHSPGKKNHKRTKSEVSA